MRALVLSGGGSKGAYQAGALQYILGEHKIHYDCVVGVSVGAINGAEVAAGADGEERKVADKLIENWNKISTDQIYKRWFPLGKAHAGWLFKNFIPQWRKPSLFDSSPLRTYLEGKLNIEAIRSSGKEFRCGAVNIQKRKFVIFDQNYKDLLGAILASSSYPAAFCPITLDGDLYTDGSIREVTPLKTAITMGATDIDVIITSAPFREETVLPKNPNLIELGPEFLDIMSAEIERTDIDRAMGINEVIKNGGKIKNKRYININVIRPENDLPYDSLEFDQEYVQSMIKMGRNDAKDQYPL